jgi:hypothetical protein
MKLAIASATLIDLPVFGATGPYLKLEGTFETAVEPSDPRNAVIADIGLAPTEQGLVRCRATYCILRPLDLAKGNGELFYDFGNRGNKRILQWLNDAAPANDPTQPEDFGHGFLMRQGYAVAWSGWAGDQAPAPGMMSIDIPVATGPGGAPITGPVVAEAIPTHPGATAISLPYPTQERSPVNGALTVREHEADPRVPVAGWAYDGPQTVRFPGPARPQWIYEFVYEARDPKVLGLGHAATRDFVSFLRSGAADDAGSPNPLGPHPLRAVYAWGRSNGARAQRDFLYWGFNEDLQGRRVFDGMMAYATGAAGRLRLNFRFAQPRVSAQQHARHHSREPEFPHTFPVMTDPLTGQTDGLLRRCQERGASPKFINIDGANEYWNKTASLNHTDAFGNDLDLATLAPDVRLYAIASIQHITTVGALPQELRSCQQLSNPLYNGPVFRALAVALDRWVCEGAPPPASCVPRRADGTLVPPPELRFPAIPATGYVGWPNLPAVQFNPGAMNHNAVLDFSTVPPRHVAGKAYTVLVPQVDEDGNEVAGIRLPDLEAPRGTYTGWSLLRPGMGGPDICGQNGQFIPFATTSEERKAAGDPRPSLEERYPTAETYLAQIARAADQLVAQGFLLEEDRERILRARAESGLAPAWTPAGRERDDA